MWSGVSGEIPPQSLRPGGEETRVDIRRQVRRRLDVHRRARARAAPPRGSAGGRRPTARARRASGSAGLARKFWTMTSWMCPYRSWRSRMAIERVDALADGFADADQDARRERDAQLPGERDGPDPARGHLVGRTVVRHAASRSRSESVSSMMPHAHVDLAQRGQVSLDHDAGVGVRADSGDSFSTVSRRRRAGSASVVRCPCRRRNSRCAGEQRLRPVAQREQRLLGAEPAARLGERHHLVRRHRVGAGLARIAAERAVAAVVATERRQRHEDLGREGDGATATAVAELSGLGQQARRAPPRVSR